MSDPILHLDATVTCEHGGSATPVASFQRVQVSGHPVVTMLTPYKITGCGSGGSTCVSAQWLEGASRVLAGGVPVVLKTSKAVCTPNGSGLLQRKLQPRVVAT